MTSVMAKYISSQFKLQFHRQVVRILQAVFGHQRSKAIHKQFLSEHFSSPAPDNLEAIQPIKLYLCTKFTSWKFVRVNQPCNFLKWFSTKNVLVMCNIVPFCHEMWLRPELKNKIHCNLFIIRSWPKVRIWINS